MNRIQTKALVEGAIFAAITVVIGIIRFYIPIIALISIVWSVPTILIAFRHGFKVSIISAVVSSLLVSILTQPIEGIGFFIGFGLPGIIMGYLLKKKLRPELTIFITSIILTACTIASMYLGMLVIGIDMVTAYDKMFIDMKSAYREIADSMANTYSNMGVGREEILKNTSGFEKSIDYMKLIFPGGLWFSGLILSYINFLLSKIVLKRINYSIEDLKPFSLWKLSRKMSIFAIFILLYTFIEIYLIKSPSLYALTMNIFSITMILFMILGVSIAKFFLDKYKFPKAVKIFLILILLLAFGNLTMLIGIIDIFFDFRKRWNNPAESIH